MKEMKSNTTQKQTAFILIVRTAKISGGKTNLSINRLIVKSNRKTAQSESPEPFYLIHGFKLYSAKRWLEMEIFELSFK